MVRPLRLGDDEVPADQLDTIVTEDAELDEPVILLARPALESQSGLRHVSAYRAVARGNVRGSRHPRLKRRRRSWSELPTGAPAGAWGRVGVG
jgi:hypothetical protein